MQHGSVTGSGDRELRFRSPARRASGSRPAPGLARPRRQRTGLAGFAVHLLPSRVPGRDAPAKYALRVDLEEFIQVFEAPGKSRAVVRFRASVLGKRSLTAQRSFSVERPAKTPDAEGGVRALIGASDEAVEQLIGWAAQQLKD